MSERDNRRAKTLFFGVKHFGNNLNQFGQLPMAERPATRADAIAPIIEENGARA